MNRCEKICYSTDQRDIHELLCWYFNVLLAMTHPKCNFVILTLIISRTLMLKICFKKQLHLGWFREIFLDEYTYLSMFLAMSWCSPLKDRCRFFITSKLGFLFNCKYYRMFNLFYKEIQNWLTLFLGLPATEYLV